MRVRLPTHIPGIAFQILTLTAAYMPTMLSRHALLHAMPRNSCVKALPHHHHRHQAYDHSLPADIAADDDVASQNSA